MQDEYMSYIIKREETKNWITFSFVKIAKKKKIFQNGRNIPLDNNKFVKIMLRKSIFRSKGYDAFPLTKKIKN